MTTSVWRSLEAVHAGALPLDAFERWVYESTELEAVLGPDRYLELISFDYRQRRAWHELGLLIERWYAALRPGELDYDRARRVAEEFLAGQRDLWSTASTFAWLRHQGNEDWVPSEFVYIDSELDTFPAPSVRPLWDSGALARLLGRQAPILAEFDRAAREAADAVLTYLASREAAP